MLQGGNLTIAELESALALGRQQQQNGCTVNCLDLGALADRLTASIDTLVTGSCPVNAANLTD